MLLLSKDIGLSKIYTTSKELREDDMDLQSRNI